MNRDPQIEGLFRDWFSAASRGDASLVDALVSENEGVRLIGSDPDEVFTGGAQVAGFLRGEVENAGGKVRFDPREIEAFSEGTVGWATTMLRITLPDGGSVLPRWCSVLHREGDQWKFVQILASIGVPNDQVGWVYPSDTEAAANLS
jgi:ketosteroid isomerase-like protein